MLISCAVTAQLICAFVFAKTKVWFAHDVAQIMNLILRIIYVYTFSLQISNILECSQLSLTVYFRLYI